MKPDEKKALTELIKNRLEKPPRFLFGQRLTSGIAELKKIKAFAKADAGVTFLRSRDTANIQEAQSLTHRKKIITVP